MGSKLMMLVYFMKDGFATGGLLQSDGGRLLV